MFTKPFARTLGALGFHARAHDDEEVGLRPVFGDANGEMPTPVEPPPPRIPPHMRHLFVEKDDALKGYSMGSYRPAATMLAEPPVVKPGKKTARTHKPGKASPLTA
ncbi:MAG TPA: hypothetical protein VGF71_13175 [Caulobacteraceae bacterium]|jgi:hypothetical protein